MKGQAEQFYFSGLFCLALDFLGLSLYHYTLKVTSLFQPMDEVIMKKTNCLLSDCLNHEPKRKNRKPKKKNENKVLPQAIILKKIGTQRKQGIRFAHFVKLCRA